jgi:hypothetical protein
LVVPDVTFGFFPRRGGALRGAAAGVGGHIVKMFGTRFTVERTQRGRLTSPATKQGQPVTCASPVLLYQRLDRFERVLATSELCAVSESGSGC